MSAEGGNRSRASHTATARKCLGAAAALSVAVAAPAVGESAPLDGETRELAIVATGDLNGWITRTILDPQDRRGLAHLAPVIARLRAEHPDLIVLDAGDSLAGSPEAARRAAAHDAAEPLAIVGVMNALRYDAAVPGNREFGLPPALLRASIRAAAFPFLAANLAVEPGHVALDPPLLYRIVERRGVRIAVLGLTSAGTPMWVPDRNLGGLRFDDPERSAEDWLPRLREQADLVIGLLHSGLDGDYERVEARHNGLLLPNAAGRIADRMPGFDLIVSASAHRLRPEHPEGGDSDYAVPVTEPGSRGNGLALALFRLERREGRWVKTNVERSTIRAEAEPDTTILALAQEALAEDKAWLDAPTATRFLTYPSKKDFDACSGALQHAAVLRSIRLTPYLPLPSGEGEPRRTRPRQATALGVAAESPGIVTPSVDRIPTSPPGEGGQGGEAAAPPSPPGEGGWGGEARFTLLPMLWRPDMPRPEALHGPIRRRDLFRWMPYEDELVRAELTGRQIAMLLEPYVRMKRGLVEVPGNVLYPGGLTPFWQRLGGEAFAVAAGSWRPRKRMPPPGAPLLEPHEEYPVWITAYVATGGGGLAPRALLHPSQLGESLPITLREVVFEYLSDPRAELPKACLGWMGR